MKLVASSLCFGSIGSWQGGEKGLPEEFCGKSAVTRVQAGTVILWPP